MGHMSVHIQEVKLKVAQELGHMYRMPRDTDKRVYGTIYDEQVWSSITSDPRMGTEKKGDLVEFVMAFGDIAPFYPCAFQQWAKSDIIRAHNQPLRDNVPQGSGSRGRGIPRVTHNPMDDEGEDEQPEAQRTRDAWAPDAEPDDAFQGKKRAPMARRSEGNGDAPKQEAQKEEDPFPPMAGGAQWTKETQGAQDADTMSPAEADWGEPSPTIESPTDAEDQEVAIEKAVQRAEEALGKAFQAALDTMRKKLQH